MHDWGAVGLALAQRCPSGWSGSSCSRRAVPAGLPLAPRGARLAHAAASASWSWASPRRSGVPARAARRSSPTRAWEHFDHGTQRAILKLYRSAPPEVLARAGERLGEVRAPALVLWREDDPYIPAEFGERLRGRARRRVELELVDGGHWPWLDRPELVEIEPRGP